LIQPSFQDALSPTGHTFNTGGSCLYMTIAALFVAQATNTPLTWMQQLSIFGVALPTSKRASGVQGASFIALVRTLMVVPAIPWERPLDAETLRRKLASS